MSQPPEALPTASPVVEPTSLAVELTPTTEHESPNPGAATLSQQFQSQSQGHSQATDIIDPPEGAAGAGEEEAPPNQSPPQSEYDVLRERVEAQPHDPPAWERLVALAEASGDVEKVKDAYNGLLGAYPNTAPAQIAYLDHFLVPGQFPVAETLFKKWLRSSASVDLWRHYLVYVRRQNTVPGMRDEVRKAYEFALNHVGQDKDSGPIWAEYIQFLKAAEPTTTWEEQQKMDALRKVYHRAVQIPLENVETLWSELETFENGLNRITAKKFMSDLMPSYMQARQVLRQLQRHLGGLYPALPPAAPGGRSGLGLPPRPSFDAAERSLVGAWKNYLKWEEGNPLELDDKDRPTLISRVQGVYRKAVVRMRFYGEIWFMAYLWTQSIGREDEAFSIIKGGIEANPASFLLHFAYAESLEQHQKFEEVHAVFEKFLDVLRRDLEEVESRSSSANSSFASNGANGSGPVPTNGNGNNTTLSSDVTLNSTQNSFASQGSDERMPKSRELAERRTEYGLVWIMYMRFARRSEGLKTSRAVFGKARKDRWTPWEVYEAAALMEYHCTKALDVASRIFEKGLDLFGDEIEFVSRYLGFLISVNDENNARAVFERVITTFTPDRARPLWERWARYEYQFGDLVAAKKMEQRIAEAYPPTRQSSDSPSGTSILGTDAIASRDLGFALARQSGSSNSSGSSLGRTETHTSLFASANNSGASANVSGASASAPAPTSDRKRPSSPDRRRDDGPAYKRQRPLSPPPPRERRDNPPQRRRFNSPSWDRERERDRDGPPPRRVDREKEEPQEKGVVLPPIISWFIGTLPEPAAFDGPVFRTDDLMQLFRNAVIPSVTAPAPERVSPFQRLRQEVALPRLRPLPRDQVAGVVADVGGS